MCGFIIEKRPEKHFAFLSVILCLCDATVLFLELLPYQPVAFVGRVFVLYSSLFINRIFVMNNEVAALMNNE